MSRVEMSIPRATVLLPMLALVAACAEPDGGGGARQQLEGENGRAALTSNFTLGDTIALEENDEVINVWPQVSVDGAGNFLVADQKESQVRVYGSSGKLVRHFGRKGNGPDEFNSTVRALPLPSGGVLVVDARGKVAVVRSGEARVSETHRLPVRPVYSASLIGDSLLLVAGRIGEKEPGSPLLHVFDLASMSLSHSFFSSPSRFRDDPIERNIGFVNATVSGDTIAAVYSVSDTVYLFRPDGTALGQVPLNSKNFRRAEGRPPKRGSNVQDLLKWVATFSLTTDVFWTPGGDFLVQYQDRDGTDMRWRLTRITREGQPVFDVWDTPRLLASDQQGSRFLFISPDSETPNVWVSASLAR